MSKYVGKFIFILIGSIVLLFLLGGLFDGGNYLETVIFAFGSVIIILLSFLISLLYYLINLQKNRV